MTSREQDGRGGMSSRSALGAEVRAARMRRRSENPPWWIYYVLAVFVCFVIGAVITVFGGNCEAGEALEGRIIFWGVVLIPVGRRGGRWAEAHRAERLRRSRSQARP